MILEFLHRLNGATRRGGLPLTVTISQLYGPGATPSPEQEAAFFGPLRLPNGTFKTTRDHRLDDLNALVATVLPNRRLLHVKDVGISSGVTTVDWAEQLEASGVKFRMTGTDLLINARRVPVTKEIIALFDAGGNVLQMDLGRYAVRPAMVRSDRRDRIFYGAILVLVARAARRRPYETLRLLSPRLLARQDVEVFEEDLLAPAGERKWDLIRAANILNLGYFPTDTLRGMIAGITNTIATDGIVAVCRTDPDGVNNASVFRRCANGYEVVGRLGHGSEVEDLVLAMAASGGKEAGAATGIRP